MHLTEQELAAASSVVAALAIIGGYLGVRSANRTAVEIADAERSSRRRDDLESAKRACFVKTFAALNSLATTSIELSDIEEEISSTDAPTLQQIAMRKAAEKRQFQAQFEASNAIAEADLLASEDVRALMRATLIDARRCSIHLVPLFLDETTKLREAMRLDLGGETVSMAGWDMDSVLYHRQINTAVEGSSDTEDLAISDGD